jgi:GAF domain-containing protein
VDGVTLHERLAGAALEMANDPRLPHTLERAVEMAVETVAPCELASVSLRRGKTLEMLAATDEVLRDVIACQITLGQGPSLDALAQSSPVVSGDLENDERWPRWGPLAADTLTMRSVLSLRLIVGSRPQGVMSMYSGATDAFTAEDVVTAQTMAAHAAIALADALDREQFNQALASRTVIGQATGIVMERFGLDEDAAFAVLRRLSQNMNVKIRDLASEVVETRRLPGVRTDFPGGAGPAGEAGGPGHGASTSGT